MMMMTMQPVKILLNRLFSGKYGSSAPVTGFLMVIGAMAVNSGRGRSCGRWRESVDESFHMTHFHLHQALQLLRETYIYTPHGRITERASLPL